MAETPLYLWLTSASSPQTEIREAQGKPGLKSKQGAWNKPFFGGVYTKWNTTSEQNGRFKSKFHDFCFDIGPVFRLVQHAWAQTGLRHMPECLQAAELCLLGIGGRYRDQFPCSTHHPRADAMLETVDASLRHKNSSTRISRVLTPKAKEYQLILLS